MSYDNVYLTPAPRLLVNRLTSVLPTLDTAPAGYRDEVFALTSRAVDAVES